MCKIFTEFLRPDPGDSENIPRIAQLPQSHHPLLTTVSAADMTGETAGCRRPKRPQGIGRIHILCIWVLFIVPGRSSALTGTQIITGHVGSTVPITCQYEKDYRTDTKYWCRGWGRLSCSVIVESTQSNQEGRTTITDNRSKRTFMVKMHQLREDDAGYYWCGISVRGPDRMLSIHLTVITGSSTADPNAKISTLPTEQELPSITSTTEEPDPSEFLEEKSLKILLPVVVILLFLFLLTTALFLRERRRQKHDMEREVSRGENMNISDTLPDMSTWYTVITKTDNADATTPCMDNTTAKSIEPLGRNGDLHPSPMIQDTFPIYAVVKKGGASRNHGIDNTALDTDWPEHHYEEIQCSHLQIPGSTDVSWTPAPVTASDQHQPYSTVEFPATAPSDEPLYYLITK